MYKEFVLTNYALEMGIGKPFGLHVLSGGELLLAIENMNIVFLRDSIQVCRKGTQINIPVDGCILLELQGEYESYILRIKNNIVSVFEKEDSDQ